MTRSPVRSRTVPRNEHDGAAVAAAHLLGQGVVVDGVGASGGS